MTLVNRGNDGDIDFSDYPVFLRPHPRINSALTFQTQLSYFQLDLSDANYRLVSSRDFKTKGIAMVKKAMVALLLVAMTTGCLGRSALTTKAKKVNLSVVENRYGREGIFLAMQVLWVYRICTVLDLLVFNSIEFWSGKNIISGQSPLVDIPLSEAKEIGFNEVNKAQVQRLTANEAKLHLDFNNGDKLTFDVIRENENYTVSYRGKEFFSGVVNDSTVKEGV